MSNDHFNLSIAALLCTLAPMCASEPSAALGTTPQSPAAQTAQELEAKVRQTAGDAVEQKAKEVADRVRGQLGAGEESDDEFGSGGDETDDEFGSDGEESDDEFGSDDAGSEALLARLASIDERLSAIEAMLATLTGGTAAAPATAIDGAPDVTHATAPFPQAGAAVTTGFEKARVRTWHHGKNATIKLTVNGIPAGRFDTDTYFDLGPFLQPGRMNQVAFAIEARGKDDGSGIELYVDAGMPGASDYVSILQFKATKERLGDTLEVPWAPR